MENKIAQETERLLRRLGLSGKYHGFAYLICAVEMAVQDPCLICFHQVTTHIYPAVAKHFNTRPNVVERNIRTLTEVLWATCDCSDLDAVAGCPVLERPTNSEIIDILAHYIRQHTND